MATPFMITPFDYLCKMRCIVGEQKCPAFDVCEVNNNFTKGIFMRYVNCCRRELKYRNSVSLEYQHLEKLVRSCLLGGFLCPVCSEIMTINNGQTFDYTIYTAEHIVPMGKGGQNKIENITVCCRKCNNQKNARDMMDEGSQIDWV